MHPTTFVYSSHNCSPYIHKEILAQRALEEIEDKRLVWLTFSEGVRDGDEYEAQRFGWDKVAWYFNQFRDWGLDPMPFFYSSHLGREDTDALLELLINAINFTRFKY